MNDDPDLGDAYALKTPEDSVRLYRNWAETYDTDFVTARGYDYPAKIAALYAERNNGDAPVLDVGCGTGLVAEVLSVRPMDGVDISPEMLSVAKGKAHYRHLIEADLTASLPLPDGAYGGFISVGTFTHGHVGPEALDELARVAGPGALFVLGVNAEVFEELNFAAKIAGMEASGLITAVEIVEGPIYAEDADHDHADDLYRALIFRRAA
ncbi:MAG: methyltransferase domain-containing protein [Pseudomonadota bacterium]